MFIGYSITPIHHDFQYHSNVTSIARARTESRIAVAMVSELGRMEIYTSNLLTSRLVEPLAFVTLIA